jgi:uncharacterized membrane protein
VTVPGMTQARHEVEPRAGVAGEQRSIALPGILLGLGLGGFFDGIVLHQMLQWHHMRSGDGVFGGEPVKTVSGLEANTLADGLFHGATWILTVVGLFLLWNRVRTNGRVRSWAELAGLVVLGWGLFNLVEGVIDHQILGVHHVRDDEGGPLAWDLAFLAWGGEMVLCGWLLMRSARQQRPV